MYAFYDANRAAWQSDGDLQGFSIYSLMNVVILGLRIISFENKRFDIGATICKECIQEDLVRVVLRACKGRDFPRDHGKGSCFHSTSF